MTFDEWLKNFWRSQEYHYLRRRFARRSYLKPMSVRERKMIRRMNELVYGS